MTALAANTGTIPETWKYKQFTMKAGQVAYQGGTALIKQSDGKVYVGASGSGYVMLGVFAEQKGASGDSADSLVNVDLLRERTVLWRANDGTITAANLGSKCYVSDDNTVSLNSTNQAVAGMILAVDTTLGVAFEVGALASEI